jgi:hypothetical protein
MPTGGQECILNRILSIGSISQVSISPSVERRHVPRENVLHFVFEDAGIKALLASDG